MAIMTVRRRITMKEMPTTLIELIFGNWIQLNVAPLHKPPMKKKCAGMAPCRQGQGAI